MIDPWETTEEREERLHWEGDPADRDGWEVFLKLLLAAILLVIALEAGRTVGMYLP
jgi:hypothetical protein